MKIFKQIFYYVTFRNEKDKINELNEELLYQQKQAIKRLINWIDSSSSDADHLMMIIVITNYLKNIIGETNEKNN